ncbi:winged helix-turn-helix transcriptional regulator [Kribbella sp. CA-294648]|uniref:winged helix-turn-helix transcriptional regulator n=1 Tax=Kribbella sp. CA-294648 TaxID=3239948 RepID=UPI003D94678A
MTRGYDQYCGLARALEILEPKWTLLIVRELLVSPRRFGDLISGVPGIATNLLATRLRSLEAAGVIERSLDMDSNSVLYKLTPWGLELRGIIRAYASWGTPLMVSGPHADDQFQPHWLVVALDSLLHTARARRKTVVGVEVEETLIRVCVDRSGTTVELETGTPPSTVLRSDGATVLGLAAGMLPVDQVLATADFRGDRDALARVFGHRTEGDVVLSAS